MEAVIASTERASRHAWAFRLVGRTGETLPPARPGSHIKVAPAGMDKSSPFSLTSPPTGEPGYEIVVAPGPDQGEVSRWFLEQGRPGKTVEVSRPRCGLPRERGAGHHVLVAGGMGLTAFLAHLSTLRAAGASYELHYAVGSRAEAIRPAGLEAAHGRRVSLYAAEEGRRLRVPELVRHAAAGSHFYVCGPPRM
ncbi:MAG TPA: hypothetical protein VKA48_00415, partial [Gammaproteobacteria bacterium]|nr:hypothetical protein [Gammaproteobacteria bacterium]